MAGHAAAPASSDRSGAAIARVAAAAAAAPSVAIAPIASQTAAAAAVASVASPAAHGRIAQQRDARKRHLPRVHENGPAHARAAAGGRTAIPASRQTIGQGYRLKANRLAGRVHEEDPVAPVAADGQVRGAGAFQRQAISDQSEIEVFDEQQTGQQE